MVLACNATLDGSRGGVAGENPVYASQRDHWGRQAETKMRDTKPV